MQMLEFLCQLRQFMIEKWQLDGLDDVYYTMAFIIQCEQPFAATIKVWNPKDPLFKRLGL